MAKINLFFFLIFCFIGSSQSLQAEPVEFSYAGGEIFGYGQGKKENIDVAICLESPSLSGMKLTGFKAYISGIDGIENTSLWMSKALTLENKVNKPDIVSFNVTPVLSPYGDGFIGELNITLPEPYTLSEEPVYIGYSMNVIDNETMEQKYPILISEGTNTNGLFLHMSKSVLKWMDYTKKAGGVAYIVAYLEGDTQDYSMSIKGYEEAYTTSGEPFDMEFVMTNNGTQSISELSYRYSFDDSTQQFENKITLPTPLAPDWTASFPVTLEFNGVEGIGSHLLNVEVTKLNGEPNLGVSPNMGCVVNVMPYVPVHRPLVEEFTGLWCGWCPRGWLAMDLLGEKFGKEEVTICYHNNDPMAVTNYYPVEFSGFPNASLNRTTIMDPYYGTYNEDTDFGIQYDVENSCRELTMADIEVSAQMEGTAVKCETTVTFMKNMENVNYEIGYVLVSNKLQDETWYQVNYYTGLGEDYKGTYLEAITQLPSRAGNLVFNDVAVDVSAMSGIPSSLPKNIKIGESYRNRYEFDFADNELVQNPDNLVVAAFVIDKNTGKIVNSNKYDFANTNGIEIIEGNSEIVSIEYYDLTGRKIQVPGNGIFIKVEKLNDGKVKTGKCAIFR